VRSRLAIGHGLLPPCSLRPPIRCLSLSKLCRSCSSMESSSYSRRSQRKAYKPFCSSIILAI
jgi:hypothetical protein